MNWKYHIKKGIWIIAIACSSCATLINGVNQNLTITSIPSGASVYMNDVNTNSITPCKVEVKRKIKKGTSNKRNELNIKLTKEGFEDSYRLVHNKINGLSIVDATWNNMWGAVMIAANPGDAVGVVLAVPLFASIPIDVMTGAMYSFPKKIDFTLQKSDKIPQIIVSNKYQFEKLSDVDNEIPQSGASNPNRFALIIGNEDYSSHQKDLSSEINVDFARNDASAFKEYALNTLGVPEKNTFFFLDATTGQMNQAISKMNLIIKATQGNAEVLVFYAGHGLPDEVTKKAYIMPVDINGKNAADGINLKTMYSKLTEFPSKRVTVFIDACFSGGARNQGLLAARGVKVKAKEDELTGNVVVFSASSGEQSSLALKDKQHGMFTYYLLSKLKETKGDVSYNELAKSIKDNVSLQSVLVNDKEQTPQVNVSGAVVNDWGNFNFK